MSTTVWRAIPNGLSVTRLMLGLALPWAPPGWRVWLVGAAAATDFLGTRPADHVIDG